MLKPDLATVDCIVSRHGVDYIIALSPVDYVTIIARPALQDFVECYQIRTNHPHTLWLLNHPICNIFLTSAFTTPIRACGRRYGLCLLSECRRKWQSYHINQLSWCLGITPSHKSQFTSYFMQYIMVIEWRPFKSILLLITSIVWSLFLEDWLTTNPKMFLRCIFTSSESSVAGKRVWNFEKWSMMCLYIGNHPPLLRCMHIRSICREINHPSK